MYGPIGDFPLLYSGDSPRFYAARCRISLPSGPDAKRGQCVGAESLRRDEDDAIRRLRRLTLAERIAARQVLLKPFMIGHRALLLLLDTTYA